MTPRTSGNPVRYPPPLREVFDAFARDGREAYLIGPRARELASGISIEDATSFDLTVDAPMSFLEEAGRRLFGVPPQAPKEERSRLWTFKVPRGPVTLTFNIGPFRNYLPPLRSLRGHRLSGILLDLATREVTIQAFGYDAAGDLVDPFGGTADFAEGLIRPVFPVETLFRESASWLLKVARYVARYGMDAAREVRQAADRDAAGILDVPREIWRKEMEKVLCGVWPAKGLQFLQDTRVLALILPEVSALTWLRETGEDLHKDVWAHTKQVVTNADPVPVVRWAALCHDIGKVWTRQISGSKVHFFRHEDMGAMLWDAVAARFEFPPDDHRRIRYIIQNHSRVNLYRDDWTDSAVRRLIREVGDSLDDLVAFSRADLTSKRAERVEMIQGLLVDLQRRIQDIREQDARESPLPKGIGNLIMERFGIPAGPEVGRLRDLLLEAIESGRLATPVQAEQCLDFLVPHLADGEPEE
ncbi:HD domain-containing protein [Myxococcota bacterium]|nr:HD domain-containing protein [Myxococcota bacterium]